MLTARSLRTSLLILAAASFAPGCTNPTDEGQPPDGASPDLVEGPRPDLLDAARPPDLTDGAVAADLRDATLPITMDLAQPACGDGVIQGAEQCDDGNRASGDGCSAGCAIEPGYACAGAPSACNVDLCARVCLATERCEPERLGLDDNCDGQVDEGCVCEPGTTHSCFKGDPSLLGAPGCVPGIETCIGAGGSGHWGPCAGGLHATDQCATADLSGCHPISSTPLVPLHLETGVGTFSANAVPGSESFAVTCPPEVAVCPGVQPLDLFQPLQSGEYSVTYTKHVAGNPNPVACTFPLFVRPGGLRVELSWEHPVGSKGVDLDLHVHQSGSLLPWGVSPAVPQDCNWANCTVDDFAPPPALDSPHWFSDTAVPPMPVNWSLDPTPQNNPCYYAPGGLGSEWQALGMGCHSPRLNSRDIIQCDPSIADPNDASFCAPETIDIDFPPIDPGQWLRVGVHDYNNQGLAADVHPTVTLYCGGQISAQLGPSGYYQPEAPVAFIASDGAGTGAGNRFWEVADVQVTVDACGRQSCTVQPLHADPSTRTPFFLLDGAATSAFIPDYPPAQPPACGPAPAGTAADPPEVEENHRFASADVLPAGASGFTGALCPAADIDVHALDVTQSGSSLRVALSDGAGGCPAGAKDIRVLLFDAGGVLVATATGSGAGGCPLLDPAALPALQSLAAGRYYASLESTGAAVVPFYQIDFTVAAPACGDGIVQVGSGEQCDDGNAIAGDGCSPVCTLERGSYFNETESNDTQPTGNSLDGWSGAVGQLSPAGDVDWYTVSVTVPGSSIFAEVGDGFGGCPSGFDSLLSLYTPSRTLLVTDDNGGVSPCSKINPGVVPAATNLPVGTFALAVQSYTPRLQSHYVLTVHVAPPGCGDGVIEAGEQCDPGPASVAGCSATCQLTGDFIPETEPNDTQALANALGTHAGFIGAIRPAGDLDYFSFNVPGPSSLVFLSVSDGVGGCPLGFDSVLDLYNPAFSAIASDDNGGTGKCSAISPLLYPAAKNLPAGTYRARVGFKGNNAVTPEYVLSVAVLQPGCGDTVLEAGEQCDDGPDNGTAGDGCSATCQSVAPWEIEPNDTMATATPLWPGYSTWKGAIRPAGDHDEYSFTLMAAGQVTLLTHDVDAPTVCSEDTILHLYDQAGTIIATDDDSGPGPGDPVTAGRCSKITQALPAGTYEALVQRYKDTVIIPAYQLDLTVQ